MRKRGMAVPIVLALALGLVGCGSGEDAAMPDVVGKKLDVALSDLDRAGLNKDDVEVVGGGLFGVVDKSNWEVCEQLPEAGAVVSDKLRLTVDRSCGDVTSEPSKSATEATDAPSEAPSDDATAEPTQAAPADDQPLTVETNADLAALLAGSASDYDMIEGFAAKYQGKIIEFDGNIAEMNNHGDYNTRYDILILAGDYSETSQTGPNFQFNDVSIVYDLHLTGSNIPDTLGVGQNLHIIAQVGSYRDPLFLLEPISTELR